MRNTGYFSKSPRQARQVKVGHDWPALRHALLRLGIMVEDYRSNTFRPPYHLVS